MRLAACFVVWALFASFAHAHKPSDSYLSLQFREDRIVGRWDIALRDLEHALGIDANGDGEITWGELRAQHQAIAEYALMRLTLRQGDRRCTTVVRDQLVDTHSDGAYAVLKFEADCGNAIADAIELDYRLLFDLDPSHRGLLSWQAHGRTVTAVLGPDDPTRRLEIQAISRLQQFTDYGKEGVWHIWIGIDHILFLLSLLLPAVFVRGARGWTSVHRFAPAFWDVLKIVTAFTVAHSITLSLAALSIISLPTRITETAIAFSVLLAALNNIWPLVHERRWLVAFGFGLIHGFGFASVLTDLGLPQDALLLALVGFNLGVEAGQLCIVAAFLPLAYLIRETWVYRRVVFYAGSAVIACFALAWMLERGLDLQLL